MMRKRAIHIGVANPRVKNFVIEISPSKLTDADWDAITDKVGSYTERSVAAVKAICCRYGIESAPELMAGDATLCKVEEAFNNAVAEIGDDGLLVVSFAGHGRLQEDKEKDELDGCDTAWLLQDHALTDDELRSWLHRVPERCTVIIVGDCCSAGGMELMKELVCRPNPIPDPPVLPRVPRAWLCAVDKGDFWSTGDEAKSFAEEVDVRLQKAGITTYELLQEDFKKDQPINQRSVIKCRPEPMWCAVPFTKPA